MVTDKTSTDTFATGSPVIISATFEAPPPIEGLPCGVPAPPQGKAIGLFELRERLSPGRPRTSPAGNEWLRVPACGSVFLLLLVYTLTQAAIALCDALPPGPGAGILLTLLACLIHGALHHREEEPDAPLPSQEQRRRFDHMMEVREGAWMKARGLGRRQLGPGTRERLLGLAVDVPWLTDAGGAPIDVDCWGDF